MSSNTEPPHLRALESVRSAGIDVETLTAVPDQRLRQREHGAEHIVETAARCLG